MEENLAPKREQKRMSEIDSMEERTPLLTKKDLQDLKANSFNFFKFYGEILSEKPEAESYPSYFLPALISLAVFFICSLFIGYGMVHPILAQRQASLIILQAMGYSFLLSVMYLVFFMLGLKLSTILFKVTGSLPDLTVATAIFHLAWVGGIFLSWLFPYDAWIALILSAVHATSLVALYNALPKTLLLKGISRFLTILITFTSSIVGIAIVFRILL